MALMMREDSIGEALKRGEISGFEYFARIEPILKMLSQCRHPDDDPETSEEAERLLPLFYKTAHPYSVL